MQVGEHATVVLTDEFGPRVRAPVSPGILAARPVPAVPERQEVVAAHVARNLHVLAFEHAAGAERGGDVTGVAVVALPGERHGLLRAANVARTGSRAVGGFAGSQRQRCDCDAEYFVHTRNGARHGSRQCRTSKPMFVSGIAERRQIAAIASTSSFHFGSSSWQQITVSATE